MDLVRQALGETQVSYYGVSYGTAARHHLRRDVPRQHPRDDRRRRARPRRVDHGRGRHRQHPPVLRAARQRVRRVAGPGQRVRRVRPGRPAAVRDRGRRLRDVWNDIIQRLRRGPFRDDGFRITYSDVVGSSLGYLYDQGSIRYLMRELKRLHRQMFGDGSSPPVGAARSTRGPSPGGSSDAAASRALRREPRADHGRRLRHRPRPVRGRGLRRLRQPHRRADLGRCGEAGRPAGPRGSAPCGPGPPASARAGPP